jgi:hypothetical protein
MKNDFNLDFLDIRGMLEEFLTLTIGGLVLCFYKTGKITRFIPLLNHASEPLVTDPRLMNQILIRCHIHNSSGFTRISWR